MIFEKAIRKRQLLGMLEGHKESDSRVITDLPELVLNPAQLVPSFLEDLVQWPEKIELLCHWYQQPLTRENVHVQEIVSGQGVQISGFYDSATAGNTDLAKHGRNSYIRLDYKKVCRVFRDGWQELPSNMKLAIPTGALYKKCYLSQESGLLVQERQLIKEGVWHVIAPKTGLLGEKILPLLAYGGFAPAGVDLAEVEQVYASVGTDGKYTTLKLYKESLLRREGVSAPEGGTIQGWRYSFIEPQVQPSLMADILNHKIKITLHMGDLKKVYVSASFKTSSLPEQLINLTMIQQEENMHL